jgi:hypothetical protein
LALWKAVVKMTIMPSRVMRQRRYLDLVLGKVVDEVNVLEEVEDKVQELLPIAFRHCSIDTPIV